MVDEEPELHRYLWREMGMGIADWLSTLTGLSGIPPLPKMQMNRG